MHDDTTIDPPAADPAATSPPLAAFTVADMTCGHCVATVRAAIQRALPGTDVTVDLASHQVRVAGGADVATVAAAAIRAAGYTPGPAR